MFMMNASFSAFSLSLSLNTDMEYSRLAIIGSHPSKPWLLNTIPSTTPARISPPLQDFAFHVLHGSKVTEYGNDILRGTAISFKHYGRGPVEKLACDLHSHYLTVLFLVPLMESDIIAQRLNIFPTIIAVFDIKPYPCSEPLSAQGSLLLLPFLRSF